MDRRDFISAMGAATAGALAAKTGQAASAGSAQIAIDFAKPAHEVSRGIYGHFIEELGKCIEGGIWRPVAGTDQFLGGVPWDLIEGVKKLRPSLIRYPGGCFADNYHWQDGIGPRESRQPKPNRFWGRMGDDVGPEVSNQFGTDEFILFCREVGAEPMLTANVGTGAPDEAAAWVEYCNGSPSSEGGAVRARGGHREPFNVKYWFVGNEMWNPADGAFTPERYARRYLEFSAAMRAKDPNLILILSGWDEPGNYWNQKVVSVAGHDADYLSVHGYYPPHATSAEGKFKKETFYTRIFRGLDRFESYLDMGVSAIAEHGPKDRSLKVAFDEWNLWYYTKEVVQANYNLRDGLFIAAMLSRLQRRAADVPIANLAQMVNCIGLIISDERGTFLTPGAWAFNLYTQHGLDRYLPALIPEKIPHLEFSATRDAAGQNLSLFLVNYDRLLPRDVTINLANFRPNPQAQLSLLTHPDPMRYNTFTEPDAVAPESSTIDLDLVSAPTNSSFTLHLKPHSLCVLRLRQA